MADATVGSLVHRVAVEVARRDTLRSVARTLTGESAGLGVVTAPHGPGRGTRGTEVRHLPVYDGEARVGVVSMRDALDAAIAAPVDR
jgi:hypothetical protein